ncbi:MAG: hypothetical protein E5Y34_11030 [Mesorhizobium sp.]|uniref:hypothetical protein n=1 Tax=Mesorhizobium sp. TaxID=1871066 RepID=UPI00122B6B9B|nr:hypothetical protein [Mesorhizobium sp.]TIN00981.1 MAG: hypothetical protein E5Y34_11030 [Mesorhizobium sp.]
MSDVDEVLKTEFSEDFVQGMRNRMVVSFYKYGPVAKGFPDKVNAITSLTDRLRKYAETGNTEFLMDAANFALIEFMHPAHPNAFFEGTDSDESPGRRSKRGVVDHRGNDEIGSNPGSAIAQFR